MKKVFSISLVLLMLTAMLHLSVATHYCGGNLAASKVSLSGKLASCGMEGTEKDLPLPGTYLNKHCCDDLIAYYGIDSYYTPSFFAISDSFQHNFQVLIIPVDLPVLSSEILKSLYTNVSPPGALMSTNVDLSDICVFRI